MVELTGTARWARVASIPDSKKVNTIQASHLPDEPKRDGFVAFDLCE